MESQDTLKIVFFVGLLLLLILLFSINGWTYANQTPVELKKVVVIENMSTDQDKEIASLTDSSKGFCETYRGKSHELEGECNKLTSERCNTTDCCVFTSNSKCSAGGVAGPTYKTDEKGNMISVDYYYYKNKCFGKCK
jgi:hypothetical protein